jgi:hypothetical protein
MLRKLAGEMALPIFARCSCRAGRSGINRCSGRKFARTGAIILVILLLKFLFALRAQESAQAAVEEA